MRKLLAILICLNISGSVEATTKFMEAGTDATTFFSFYSVSAGASSDNAVFHTGLRSIKLNDGAGPTLARATTGNNLTNTGGRVTCYFRYNKSPDAYAEYISLQTSGGANVVSFGINNDSTTAISAPGVSTINGSTVLTDNAWHRICISFYITNSTTFRFKIYLDGVLEHDMNSTGTLTNTALVRTQFQVPTVSGTNRTSNIDDIYADDGASSGSQPDTGDIYVIIKRPFANGGNNDFSTQIGASGSGYGSGHAPQVNERPLSTTNGWSMIGAGSAVTEDYNIEGVSVGDVDITGKTLIDVQCWLFASSGVSETGKIICDNVQTNISLTSSQTLFTKFLAQTTFPAGSGTDLGIITATTLTTVNLYEAGVQIAYNPVASGATGCAPPLCGIIQ